MRYRGYDPFPEEEAAIREILGRSATREEWDEFARIRAEEGGSEAAIARMRVEYAGLSKSKRVSNVPHSRVSRLSPAPAYAHSLTDVQPIENALVKDCKRAYRRAMRRKYGN